jgi:oligopeptide transport system ATP-binding protein
MIFQDPIASLNPRMTVREIISEGMVIKGIKDKNYIDEQVYDILDKVGLVREHAGRYPHEFSGGQRQRIGIARSVVMRPEMIIADEPVSALDVSVQARILNLFRDLRRELSLSIILIAHDLAVVKNVCDNVAVMEKGLFVDEGPAERVFSSPKSDYTKRLFEGCFS